MRGPIFTFCLLLSWGLDTGVTTSEIRTMTSELTAELTSSDLNNYSTPTDTVAVTGGGTGSDVTRSVTDDIPKPREYVEMKIAKAVDLYGGGFVLIFGVIGNTLCIIVLRRKRLKLSVASTYMVALAVVDICSLVSGQLGRHWVRTLSGVDLPNTLAWYCKVWFHVCFAFLTYSNWILTIMSAERCFVVLLPLKAKGIVTKGNAKIALALSGIIILLYYAHAYTSYKLNVNLYGSTVCVPDFQNYFSADVRPWLDFVLKAILPGVIIVVCNGLIVTSLILASVKRTKLQITEHRLNDESQLRSLVFMLISVSIAFVVLTSPIHVQWIIDNAFTGTYVTSGREAAIERMEWAIKANMVYLNHAINFLLYLISGQAFRRELLSWVQELFPCCGCACKAPVSSRESGSHSETSSKVSNVV